MGSMTDNTSRALPGNHHTLLASINQTAAPRPDVTLLERIVAQAVEHPQRVAVITADLSLTYGALLDRGRQLAHVLESHAPQRDRPIAIVMEHGWEQIVAVLGALYAGRAWLTIAPDLATEQRTQQLETYQIVCVLTQSWLSARLSWPAAVTLSVDTLATDPLDQPFSPAGNEALVCLAPSSEATAPQSPVALTQRAIDNTISALNLRFSVGPSDRVLALLPLSSDVALYDMLGLLSSSGGIVVPAASELRDPQRWLELMARHSVTIWTGTPPLLSLLLDAVEQSGQPLPTSLRLLLVSRETLSVQLRARLHAHTANTTVAYLVGSAESGIWSTCAVLTPDESDQQPLLLGRPLANQRIWLLGEDGQICPMWVTGRLYIGGDSLAEGYWHDEQATQAQWTTHPQTGERLFRSQNFARLLPEGSIEFMGTELTQIRLHGHPVDLHDVEMVLAEHPAVRDAVVVPAPVGDELVAYVVVPPSLTVTGNELRLFLRSRISDYLVPAQINVLAALPLTADGRIDRGALRTQPLPAVRETSAPTPQVQGASASEITGRFVRLAAANLGMSTLDPEMNLLDLGANSVELIQIFAQAEQELGLIMDVEEFLRFPYVTTLVKSYERQMQSQPKAETAVVAPERPAAAPGDGLIVDPVARDAFKAQQHGLRHDLLDRSFVALSRPAALAQQEPAIIRRRSSRQFAQRTLALDDFSGLLGALRQVTAQNEHTYWYASAGGLYPVQTYIHLKQNAVDGIAGGTYYYHPVDHRLVTLARGVEIDRGVHAWINRDIFDRAAFSIHLVGDLKAIAPLYGTLARDFCIYEAGSMGQLLMMVAPEFKIGLCGIGEMNFEQVRHLFSLQANQILLHTLLGGPLNESQPEVEPGTATTSEDTTDKIARMLDRVRNLSVDGVRRQLGRGADE